MLIVNFYVMTANGGNSATAKTNWTLPSGTSVAAMVYDNTGQTLYVTTPSGLIYGCSNLAGVVRVHKLVKLHLVQMSLV